MSGGKLVAAAVLRGYQHTCHHQDRRTASSRQGENDIVDVTCRVCDVAAEKDQQICSNERQQGSSHSTVETEGTIRLNF